MKVASGKFVVRIPPELHGALKQESLARGVSLNELCQEKLASSGTVALRSEALWMDQTLQKLKATAAKLGLSVLGVILFGSFARGEESENSDLDLLVVLSSNDPIDRQLYLKWDGSFREFSQHDSHEVSVHFVHLPEWIKESGSLWLECAMDGKVLDESNPPQLSKRLYQLRDLISQGFWKRKYAHGHPYWIKETQ
jgi:Nucleotidyltransferase domain/HicB family